MARATINAIRSQVDLQKTYYWNIAFLGPTGFFNFGGNRLDMQCTSTEIPRYEGETAEVMFKGYQILDPGIYKTVGKMQLTFIEMVDSQVRIAWDNWMAACSLKVTPFSGLYGNFLLNTTDNQDGVNYSYILRYCFPDATDPAELSSNESDPMVFKVTLRYTDVATGLGGGQNFVQQ